MASSPVSSPTVALANVASRSDLVYVGFLTRFLAFVLDIALFVVLCAVVEWPLTLVDEDLYMNGTNLWVGLFQRLLWTALVLGFWATIQSTPGKRVVHASIVDARTGLRPAFWQLVVRYLGYALSLLPLGLGFFWMIWDPRRQAWHDKLSQTVVVRPAINQRATFPEAP